MNKTINQSSLLLKTGSLITHILIAFVAIIFTATLLIASNHATIVLLANALTPVFLFLLPVLTLALAAGVIFLRQPVHNLLCLISVFFTTVLLYLYAGAEFLAFLFLIVYVGAIAILFLFVIMLLHLKQLPDSTINTTKGTIITTTPLLAVVVIGLDDNLTSGITEFFISTDLIKWRTVVASASAVRWFVNFSFADINVFSTTLYTTQSFLFLLSGLLLLTAMLGAIILATSATDEVEISRKKTRPYQRKRLFPQLKANRLDTLNIQLCGGSSLEILCILVTMLPFTHNVNTLQDSIILFLGPVLTKVKTSAPKESIVSRAKNYWKFKVTLTDPTLWFRVFIAAYMLVLIVNYPEVSDLCNRYFIYNGSGGIYRHSKMAALLYIWAFMTASVILILHSWWSLVADTTWGKIKVTTVFIVCICFATIVGYDSACTACAVNHYSGEHLTNYCYGIGRFTVLKEFKTIENFEGIVHEHMIHITKLNPNFVPKRDLIPFVDMLQEVLKAKGLVDYNETVDGLIEITKEAIKERSRVTPDLGQRVCHRLRVLIKAFLQHMAKLGGGPRKPLPKIVIPELIQEYFKDPWVFSGPRRFKGTPWDTIIRGKVPACPRKYRRMFYRLLEQHKKNQRRRR